MNTTLALDPCFALPAKMRKITTARMPFGERKRDIQAVADVVFVADADAFAGGSSTRASSAGRCSAREDRSSNRCASRTLASISNLVVVVSDSASTSRVVAFTNSSNEFDEDVDARELLNARSAALCMRSKRAFRDDSDGDDAPYGSSRVSSPPSLREPARTHRRERRLDASFPMFVVVVIATPLGRPPRRTTDAAADDAVSRDRIATRFAVPRGRARITDSDDAIVAGEGRRESIHPTAV